MIILSTCNRVELYAVAPGPAFEALEAFLEETRGMPRADFSPFLYRLQNEETAAHLLRVAAGLDSLVLGEPQILGQVTEALAIARSQGTAGKILSRLFQTAIHAGKRARTETAISHNPASISSVAVKLISESVPDLRAAQTTVLGAGEMAELAVEALRKRGASRICVVNRTLARAQVLAQKWGGNAATFETLSEYLPHTDILITSTGAPHTLIHPPMVADAMRQRPQRPLVIMDIALPRDVDAQVAQLPNVVLFDLDTLSTQLDESLSRRAAEVPRVERILADEQAAFMHYLATLEVVPIIVHLRQQANHIRQAELEKTLRRLPGLTPSEQERIDYLTRAIVQKILHAPTACLRQEASGPRLAEYAQAARALFALDGFPPPND
jgi:glutamyl-tRNA reductase